MQAALIYPHQLFANHPAVAGAETVVFVEDPLFFAQYRFHRQKLVLHRASMKRYAAGLQAAGARVRYLEAAELSGSGEVADRLASWGVRVARVVDPCDDWLTRRLTAGLQSRSIRLDRLDDPHFLTPVAEIERFTAGKEGLFFHDFYVAQRKRLGLLLDRGRPVGGKWSFDAENRKKLPKGVAVPPAPVETEDPFVREARAYVSDRFPGAVGGDEPFRYPIDHAGAAARLDDFVARRLDRFGDYEDAISVEHDVLFHSVLTPALNAGLLSPRQVIDAAVARSGQVPLNALEGFVRQVIGWREFVRLVYLTRGRVQRTRNFWGLTRNVPSAFYTGTTGIDPVDHVIRRVLRTGYCHHIERLMVLGNFFLLCDVSPDAVYRWFMELFVDAYDWVMVPNVYGMSQHADGGLMTTKPYVSGSSYVLKMSDFKKGPWCGVWDALYWRFVDRNAAFFAANPRTAMIAKLKDRLGTKMTAHHRVAEAFLDRLHR
ncbi:cryptochrome/photolyase family protein [Gemmata sp. JC673]|uniref:Cryptochrome/photolyase family protein n=1 Tax=Gemmata algarum TaxID=2975278 RepID=A0ABU5EQN3_9BACT|nr:cryptochrome/photolyase family protein [Gemmata algarum]MDY3557574.1 cryptochrome/photolyase family protein [Gemmata algarum]